MPQQRDIWTYQWERRQAGKKIKEFFFHIQAWPIFRMSCLTSNDLNLRLILPPPMIQIYGRFSHLKGSNQEKSLTGVPSLGFLVNSVQNKTKHLRKTNQKNKRAKHIAVRSSDLSVNIEENVLSNLWESWENHRAEFWNNVLPSTVVNYIALRANCGPMFKL